MPGRQFNNLSYRYGMNGQEKDNGVYLDALGMPIDGALTTAEFWEYDSRIIRRWNTDPVVHPWESPYACFANNPIWFSDVNGDEATSDGDPPAKKGQAVVLDDGQVITLSVDEVVIKPPSLLDKGAEALNNIGNTVGNWFKKQWDFVTTTGNYGTGTGGNGGFSSGLKRMSNALAELAEMFGVLKPSNKENIGTKTYKPPANGQDKGLDKGLEEGRDELVDDPPKNEGDTKTQPVLKKATKDTIIKQATPGMTDTLYLIYSVEEYREKGKTAEPKRVELGKGKNSLIEVNE